MNLFLLKILHTFEGPKYIGTDPASSGSINFSVTFFGGREGGKKGFLLLVIRFVVVDGGGCVHVCIGYVFYL